MVASNMGSVPAQSPQQRGATADRGDHGPMPQQDAGDSHGHEMHPQRLVQLVGCHDANAEKHEPAHRQPWFSEARPASPIRISPSH
jgi:hypothetical protein